MIAALLLSLILTEAIELTVAWLWGLRGRDLPLCALVNVVTNPVVVLLHAFFPAWPVTLLLEGAAVAAEGLYYRRYAEALPSPWLFSLTANVVSFTVGLVLNSLL